jgi:hypothetical protein
MLGIMKRIKTCTLDHRRDEIRYCRYSYDTVGILPFFSQYPSTAGEEK